MSLIGSYRLRLRRKRWLLRAYLRRRDLTAVQDRTATIRQHDILLCCCLRNERVRLPFFVEYYRKLGINHFLFIDNGSDDGSREWLAEQADVSVWSA
ncbi:MAG: glycosyltransferase family 2 protein, partial [Gemmobacter sp.]|nr:glycosyltransferase family 2 protein [Gemmobacter sp.]